MGKLDDKIIIITGASSGIGRATAKLFVAEGAKVTVMARNEKKLKELKKEVTNPENILIVPGDVTKESDCKNVVKATLKQWNQLDGLLHNAGISMRARADESNSEVFKSIMATNFFSLVYLYKAGIDSLKESKGIFATVSSMMGKYSTQLRSGYTASKHAMVGFMDSVRLEVMEDGVHVMTVIPGFVNTNVAQNALTADGARNAKQDAAIAGGLPPEKTAEDILEGFVDRPREVVSSHFKERFALFLSKVAPGLLDKMLLKINVT